jgi:hypothetical protein
LSTFQQQQKGYNKKSDPSPEEASSEKPYNYRDYASGKNEKQNFNNQDNYGDSYYNQKQEQCQLVY